MPQNRDYEHSPIAFTDTHIVQEAYASFFVLYLLIIDSTAKHSSSSAKRDSKFSDDYLLFIPWQSLPFTTEEKNPSDNDRHETCQCITVPAAECTHVPDKVK